MSTHFLNSTTRQNSSMSNTVYVVAKGTDRAIKERQLEYKPRVYCLPQCPYLLGIFIYDVLLS